MSESSPATDHPTTTPDPTNPKRAGTPKRAAIRAPAGTAKPGRNPNVRVWVGLLVAAAGVLYLRPAVGDWLFGVGGLFGPHFDDYKVGACIDSLPSTSTTKAPIPDLVDCSGSSAKAKIVVETMLRLAQALGRKKDITTLAAYMKGLPRPDCYSERPSSSALRA